MTIAQTYDSSTNEKTFNKGIQKTINKQIDFLLNELERLTNIGYTAVDLEEELQELIELNYILEQIEKKCPKPPINSLKLTLSGTKVKIKKKNHAIGDCPLCHSAVNSEMNYCDYCGQRLEWEEK